MYIADTYNNRVRKVTTSGIISTFAGTGTPSFSGDGPAATSATLNEPTSVAVDANNNVFIADLQNSRVRKVTPGGVISTYAGNGGDLSVLGDGGPATNASLAYVKSIAVDKSGNLYIQVGGQSQTGS